MPKQRVGAWLRGGERAQRRASSRRQREKSSGPALSGVDKSCDFVRNLPKCIHSEKAQSTDFCPAPVLRQTPSSCQILCVFGDSTSPPVSTDRTAKPAGLLPAWSCRRRAGHRRLCHRQLQPPGSGDVTAAWGQIVLPAGWRGDAS